ncbi:MAG: hypothetical protein A4E55_00324 [Pelotomaculum sp. PtaU1.Bin035]|nr:MAG: hypothetical protein A4E55_00324 [Pelotomaculum sp. PtaU1.Bin035]
MYKKLITIIVLSAFAVMSLALPVFACSGGIEISVKSPSSKDKQKPGKEKPNVEKPSAGDVEKPTTGDNEKPDTGDVGEQASGDIEESEPSVETPNFVHAPTVIKVNRILIPVKSIEKGLKAQITWDESLNIVLIEKDGKQIKIDLSNKVAIVNGTAINLAKGKSKKATITLSTGLVKKLLKQAVSVPVTAPVDAEKVKYETAATIDNTVAQGADVTATVVKLLAGQTAGNTVAVAVTAVNAADGTGAATCLAVNNGTVTLAQQNTTGASVTEKATITFSKDGATATLVVTVTINPTNQTEQPAVDLEKVKYETAATIDNTVAQGADVTATVVKLLAGQTADNTVTAAVTAVNAADGTGAATCLAVNNGTVTLVQQNTTGAPVTEKATITFSKDGVTATLVVAVTISNQ